MAKLRQMSEPDKPAQVEATTSTNGTGLPDDSVAMAVTEKSCEKENGLKTAAVEEEEKHEKKEMDVKMEEATGVNDGEEKESEEGRGMEKMEPMKVKMEEKETEERELIKVEEEYKETKEHDTCQETQDKGEGKVEEAEGKGEEAEDIGEGAEGTGDKGEGAVEKAVEAEKMGEEIEDKGGEGVAEQAEEHEKEKGASKKRPRSHKPRRKGEMKEEESVKTEGELRTPVVSSVDHPVRERKTVERLVESLEKQQAKGFLIEKVVRAWIHLISFLTIVIIFWYLLFFWKVFGICCYIFSSDIFAGPRNTSEGYTKWYVVSLQISYLSSCWHQLP